MVVLGLGSSGSCNCAELVAGVLIWIERDGSRISFPGCEPGKLQLKVFGPGQYPQSSHVHP